MMGDLPVVAQPRPAGPVRGGAGLVDRPGPHDALARGAGARAWCSAFEHDVDSPPRYARLAAEAIPGSEYREVAGAGHIGILTHADKVAAYLIEFFEQY